MAKTVDIENLLTPILVDCPYTIARVGRGQFGQMLTRYSLRALQETAPERLEGWSQIRAGLQRWASDAARWERHRGPAIHGMTTSRQPSRRVIRCQAPQPPHTLTYWNSSPNGGLRRWG